MPDSPTANLEEIKNAAEEIIKPNTASTVRFEEEPIAFGLKAVIAQFTIDESKEMDPIENKLRAIAHVNSCEVIDFRRAFG